ncbi:MAG: metal-dependent hydrolase [Balneolaceae bacterium]
MDPIAHTLFGAGMAEAGLRSKTALATATLVIGANLPDVDALAMFIDSDTALYLRRGWTHGILALLIWPFLLAGTMLLFQRLLTRFRTRRARAGGRFHPTHNGPSMRLKWLLGISFLAVWSHPLLDWMNTYGIRLLMPFSDTWFYGDTLFIVDPWLWLLSGAGVVLARSRTKLGMSGWVLLGAALTTLVITAVMVPTAAKVVWGAGILTIALVRFSGRTGRVARPIAFSLMMAALLYSAYMFAGARVTAGLARAHLAEEGVRV